MANENQCLKNLINLCSSNNINIYEKNKIKSKDKIINECIKVKKKELKTSSTLLSNLAKLNTDINQVKDIYKNLENKINHIDQVIKMVNSDTIDNTIFNSKINNTDTDTEYIESYSNC